MKSRKLTAVSGTRYVVIAASLLVLGSGCFSRHTGSEGRFTFAYPAAANVLDFNKPIAPGARLDLYAQSLGEAEELEIAEAISSNPAVLRVIGRRTDFVTIQAGAVGNARITFRTIDGVTDSVEMHVATPEKAEFGHACTNEAFAVYPADSEVVLPFSLTRGEGEVLAGYGFWPIRVRPAEALSLDRSSRDQGALHFTSTGTHHRVSIRSTIDESLIGLALATPEEIDAVDVDDFGLPQLTVGTSAIAGFVPTVAGVPFCQADLRTKARSLTPEICAASGRLGDEDDEENTNGLVRIEGRKYGVCEFEVSFPSVAQGQGIVQRHRVAVGKYPSLSGDSEPLTGSRNRWLAPLLALLAPLMLFPILRRFVRS